MVVFYIERGDPSWHTLSKIVLRLSKGNTASNCGNRVRAVCNQAGRESAPVAWVMTKGTVKSQTDASANIWPAKSPIRSQVLTAAL